LAAVQSQDKWAYIDRSAKIRIAGEFMDAESFSSGIARVKVAGKWCYIDSVGKTIQAPLYGSCSFPDGPCRIRIHEKIGYVDRDLRTVVSAEFDDADGFSQGLAPVKKGFNWGYIDDTGHVAIPFHFGAADRFSEGLAAVEVLPQAKKGYINKSGTIIINPNFDFAFAFSEGLAPVVFGGRWIDSPEEHTGVAFSDGNWGYIDKTGKVVVRLSSEVEYASGFKQGVAYVRLKDGRLGYVNPRGHYLWKPSK
jgi:hypothetical protein